MDLTIRAVTKEAADSWLRLRCALWPEGAESEHRREIEQFFAGDINEPQAVWLAFGMLFPRCGGRGSDEPSWKRRLRGGRAQGCIEFGSDTEPDNEISRVAHHALGFQDVGLVRCFRKAL